MHNFFRQLQNLDDKTRSSTINELVQSMNGETRKQLKKALYNVSSRW